MTYSAPCINSNPMPFAPADRYEARAGEPLILVVDDEWSIRRFLCTVLQRTAHACVVEASSPTEALSVARAMGRPADLLISDIDLHSGKNGIELARELAGGNPSTKVLLMSGGDHSESSIPNGWRFLAKPFPIAVFLDCVNELCPGAWNQTDNTP